MKWRINFSIINSNFNLVGYAASEFLGSIPRKDGKQLFEEWYLEHGKGEGATISYVPIDIMESVVEWIKEKVVEDPEWAEKLHQEAEKMNWDYFNYAKSLVNEDFSSFSNEELLGVYKELRRMQLTSHVHAVSTTWFLDSDGEVYSNYLKDELRNHLSGCSEEDIIKYFTIFTTPTKDGFAQWEQIDLLNLVLKAQEKDSTEENIEKHWKKWCWTPYGYVGPTYDLDYYVSEVEKNMSLDNVSELIKEEESRYEKIKEEQRGVIEKIKLPDKLNRLFAIAQDIIWLKDFRKYCTWTLVSSTDLSSNPSFCSNTSLTIPSGSLSTRGSRVDLKP